jgi:hypothetical protein
MRYVPKNCVGFEMTDNLADALGLSEDWETWDGDEHDSVLLDAIEEKFGVSPWGIAELREERGGHRTGITGFEDGYTYLLFEERDTRVPNWKAFSDLCEEAGSTETEGSWSQLM